MATTLDRQTAALNELVKTIKQKPFSIPHEKMGQVYSQALQIATEMNDPEKIKFVKLTLADYFFKTKQWANAMHMYFEVDAKTYNPRVAACEIYLGVWNAASEYLKEHNQEPALSCVCSMKVPGMSLDAALAAFAARTEWIPEWQKEYVRQVAEYIRNKKYRTEFPEYLAPNVVSDAIADKF